MRSQIDKYVLCACDIEIDRNSNSNDDAVSSILKDEPNEREDFCKNG
jgi:hypothetical protein